MTNNWFQSFWSICWYETEIIQDKKKWDTYAGYQKATLAQFNSSILAAY